jgi:hypothetical protein
MDEPERVYEIAIDDLQYEDREAAPEPAPPDGGLSAPRKQDELAGDISGRFEDLGARLAAGIQQQVLRSLEASGVSSAESSSADDIAVRVASLGDGIDARIRDALARKGLVRDDD